MHPVALTHRVELLFDPEQYARALVNKGVPHGQLGRGEGVIEVYDDVVQRLGETIEPALRRVAFAESACCMNVVVHAVHVLERGDLLLRSTVFERRDSGECMKHDVLQQRAQTHV